MRLQIWKTEQRKENEDALGRLPSHRLSATKRLPSLVRLRKRKQETEEASFPGGADRRWATETLF